MNQDDLDYLQDVRAALINGAAMLKLLSRAATNTAGVDETLTLMGDVVMKTDQYLHEQRVGESEYPSWEYRTLVITSDDINGATKQLNQLGKDGWELASTVYMPSRVADNRTVYYLKR